MKHFTYSLLVAIIATFALSNTALGQIALRGSATSTSTNTTVTVTKPAGVILNDVMIAIVAKQGNTGDATAPAGWTLLDGANLGGNTARNGSVFYKVAGAAEAANYAFTLGAGTNQSAATIIAFSGVSTVNPFDVAAGTIQTSGNNTSTISDGTITTVTANAAVILCGMSAGSNRSISGWTTTSPGALTEISDIGIGNTGDGARAGAAWAIKNIAGATGTGSATLSDDERNGGYLLALRPAVVVDPVPLPNLWSCSGTGAIRKYTMDPITGALLAGPAAIINPITSTAAIAKNAATPFDAQGCIYYLNRDDDNSLNGVVTVYSVQPDGTNNGSRGTIDMNGAGNADDFSFVRLGFDAAGNGWILAGSGNNIYIASFRGNGTAAISNVNTFGNITLTVPSPGSAAEFQNGDLAITASGTLYAVANVTDGQTYVYTLNSLATPTTLTRKWTVQNAGGTFSGSVNGLAWTQSGSLHFSTSTGIYFIDQLTANSGAGTVQATLVAGTTGLDLTDLGSDRFPTQTTLPVTLVSFAGSYRNQVTSLNWVTENVQGFDRFELERSTDGRNFATIAVKQPVNSNQSEKATYLHNDDLSAVSGTAFYYRLKMIDLDGKFKYSAVILVRKEQKTIVGLTVSPNPVISGGTATVRFESAAKTTVNFNVVDMSGRIVLKQQNSVTEGTNSVTINNLDRLQPGMYVLQMNDGTVVNVTKFTIAH